MGSVTQLPTLRDVQADINDLYRRVETAAGGAVCQDERIETLKALVGHLLSLLVDRRILSTSDVAILINDVPKLTDAVVIAGARVLADVEHYASDLPLADKGRGVGFLVDADPDARAARVARLDELSEASRAAWPFTPPTPLPSSA